MSIGRQIKIPIAPVFGAFLYLLSVGPVQSGDISEGCRDTYLDVVNALRACDVVIGRTGTLKPDRIRAFQVRAKIHLAAGNLTAALNDFTSAVNALPEGKLRGYVLFLRARSRFDYSKRSVGVLRDSILDLQQANALAPGNPRILETLARVYASGNLHNEAVSVATEAIHHDPRAIDARRSRAKANEALGRTRAALDDLDHMLSRRIADPDLLAWRGRLHEKRNNVKRALADYRNAARRKSTQEVLDGIKRMETRLSER